jgi:PII-like signaling protein
MKTNSDASLMRIYLQESERSGHQALYEVIVSEARDALSSRILDLSSDLPIVVEIIDREDRIDAFLEKVNTLLEESDSGALVTMEKARVVRYRGSEASD